MKRALVVGSQIRGLKGVESDVLAITAVLAHRGFEVDLRTGDRATRAGMLHGYNRLIEQSSPDDAAVVYYSGHGCYGVVPGEDRAWQCIVPTDLDAGTESDFRGITAWELSLLQTRLTRKTRNVTVILECCHASHMSRDSICLGAIVRALPHPVKRGFTAHLEALRSCYGDAIDDVDPLGNPDAVRLVASGQVEPAFEYRHADGRYGGAFTRALVDVFQEVGDQRVSWCAIIAAVRSRVMRYFAIQRPDVEGPAWRRPFSLDEDCQPHDGPVQKI